MRPQLSELATFAVVAQERSFTRAALRLGMSQSALSHAIRDLESKTGLQLLARTTRSVAPTAAGSILLNALEPAIQQVEAALVQARELRDRPSGRVRLLMSRSAASMVLVPRLSAFVKQYPEILLDVVTVSGPVDLIAGEFDAGILLGDFIQRDMIVVRVTEALRLAVVGSPDYFKSHGVPKTPHDLRDHQCIGIRSSSGAYRWDFQKGRKKLSLNVSGPLVIDDPATAIQAAIEGAGLGLAFEEQTAEHCAKGRLIRVLEDWCPQLPGFFMFYPSRRNQPAALMALIKVFRVS